MEYLGTTISKLPGVSMTLTTWPSLSLVLCISQVLVTADEPGFESTSITLPSITKKFQFTRNAFTISNHFTLNSVFTVKQ